MFRIPYALFFRNRFIHKSCRIIIRKKLKKKNGELSMTCERIKNSEINQYMNSWRPGNINKLFLQCLCHPVRELWISSGRHHNQTFPLLFQFCLNYTFPFLLLLATYCLIIIPVIQRFLSDFISQTIYHSGGKGSSLGDC